MTHDRDYYRCTATAELIRLARDSGHELAIALGERLDDMGDLEDELEAARDSLELASSANQALRAEIEAHEERWDALMDADSEAALAAYRDADVCE